MIFQHTWEKVLSGQKTQTRRIVKAGDYAKYQFLLIAFIADGQLSDETRSHKNPIEFIERDRKVIYSTDKTYAAKTYAVQPARGQKAVGRIRITSIRREDVRNVSDEDVKAEGFDDPAFFFETWCSMHDPALKVYFYDCLHWTIGGVHYEGWTDDLLKVLAERPAKFYDAWVLTFELVEVANEH